MDKRSQLPWRWAFVTLGFPLSAHAFIDERTPKKEETPPVMLAAPAAAPAPVLAPPAAPVVQVAPAPTQPTPTTVQVTTQTIPAAPALIPAQQANNTVTVETVTATASPEAVTVTTVDTTPVAPVVQQASAPRWTLQEGKMLSHELESYAKANNIKVMWEAKVDYKITVGFTMNKPTLIKNIDAVIALYEKSMMPLTYTWYEKQNLLLVQDKTIY